MPGVILIDDEPAARRGFARMLQAHADVRLLGEAASVSAARVLLDSLPEPPDAVFLDIEMPRGNGFELIQSLSSRTRIIFVTAHTGHAPLAFEVDALDYLLKPVRPNRLAQSLERLRRSLAPAHPPASVDAPPATPFRPATSPADPASASSVPLGLRDHLCLNCGGRTLIVPVADIIALRADGDFTRFWIEGQPSVLMGQNLGKYMDTLPPDTFVRVSRSLSINLRRVVSLESLSRDNSLLKLRGMKEPVPLRRLAAARLRTLL